MQLELTTKKALTWSSVAAVVFVGSLFIVMSSSADLFTRALLLSALFLLTLTVTLFPSIYLWRNRHNVTVIKTLILLLFSVVLIYLFYLGWRALLNIFTPTVNELILFLKNLFEYFGEY